MSNGDHDPFLGKESHKNKDRITEWMKWALMDFKIAITNIEEFKGKHNYNDKKMEDRRTKWKL